jgi:hypothetical protein
MTTMTQATTTTNHTYEGPIRSLRGATVKSMTACECAMCNHYRVLGWEVTRVTAVVDLDGAMSVISHERQRSFVEAPVVEEELPATADAAVRAFAATDAGAKIMRAANEALKVLVATGEVANTTADKKWAYGVIFTMLCERIITA